MQRDGGLNAASEAPKGHAMTSGQRVAHTELPADVGQPAGRNLRRGLHPISRLNDAPQATFGAKLADRSAVAVETALMLPVLFFLFFGMVGFGLYWQADHTINEASRAGARLGATLAQELNYEDDIVEAVQAAIADNIPSGEVLFLTIFKADPATGDPVSGTVAGCNTDCYRYNWNEASQTFDPVIGPEWAPGSQSACGEIGHNDYMGVYVEGITRSVTRMFGADRPIRESSIIRLEPVPLSNTCEPTT